MHTSRIAALPMLLGLTLCAPAQQIVAGPTVSARDAGDVDGDGYDDLLVHASGLARIRSGRTGQLFPHLSWSISSTAWIHALQCDVDGDGCADLVFTDMNVAPPVIVVSGRLGTTLFSVSTAYPMTTAAAAAGDWDLDGCDDLLVGVYPPGSANRVFTMLSGRTGQTIFQHQYAVTSWTSYTLAPVGDVDGDGRADLVRTFTDRSTGGGPIPTTTNVHEVLRGPGLTAAATATSPETLVGVGDTNGDHIDELAYGTNGIVSGTLQPIWPIVAWHVLSRTFDVDGDGHVDIVTSSSGCWSGRTRAVMAGATPAGYHRLLGDIDGDGRTEFTVDTVQYEWQDPGVPQASRLVPRGAGGFTHTGTRPRLAARGHGGLGRTIGIDLRGGLPSGIAFLAVGSAVDLDLASAGAPGNRAYVMPAVAQAIGCDLAGLGRTTLLVPAATALLGTTSSLQFAVLDLAANALGIVTSNAVDVSIRT
jgi:hypothetical protein